MVNFRNSSFFKEKQLHEIFKDGKYVLQGDFPENDVDDDMNKKYQFGIPPQPFQGDPDAAIWVLLANPRYQEMDAAAEKQIVLGDKSLFRNSRNRMTCIDQLSFKKTEGRFCNYVLNHEFNNYYGRNWFFDHFTGKYKLLSNARELEFRSRNPEDPAENHFLDRLDERFFLLQVHGYASKEYDDSDYFPHMEYNKALLRWGIGAGKVILIARSIRYWQKVIESMEHDDAKIFVMLNYRNSSFTRNNLVRYDEWKQSRRILTIAGARVEQDLESALGR